MKRRLIVIDFEVLSKTNFWLCCMKDIESGMEFTIVNDSHEFKRVFNKNKESIWLGYNIKGYDQWIMRAILSDIDPCMVSEKLINEKVSGGRIDRRLHSIRLLFFEVSQWFRGLKELELFMGESIVESSVSFELNRYPSKKEIDELSSYCMYDVRMTTKVFEFNKHEFDAHKSLIEMFNLDYNQFNRTKTQISCTILEAKRPNYERNDNFEFDLIDTLSFSKYQYIKDWYENHNNRSYQNRLRANVYGLETEFGWGGIHSSRRKYLAEKFIVNSDVSSFYPSIIIEYNLLSRNVKSSHKYKEIRDMRMKFKKEKDPREYPLKIVLNSVYGACKDLNSDLYDPQIGDSICVNGQLLLLDLIEKVELEFKDRATFIQCNTDGVMFKFSEAKDIEKYLEICKEWSNRTKMSLEHDMIDKIILKDVNNYIYIQTNGDVKSKGAYVKDLSILDNDLAIVNKAVKSYLINNIPVEDTINNCNNLIDFQKCVKLTNSYDYIMHGTKKMNLKVLRVFASKNASDSSIYKVKNDLKSTEKFANTPDRVFIDNHCIKGKNVPNYLDRYWYISLAKKRIEDFYEEPQHTLFDLL